MHPDRAERDFEEKRCKNIPQQLFIKFFFDVILRIYWRISW